MIRRHTLLLLLLLSSSHVQAQWTHEGKAVPDEPWRKSVRGFGAMLLLTNKADAFFKEWDKPPSPDYQPSISTTSEARRGQTVVAVVMFTKCKRSQEGACKLDVDYKVLRPDGSTYAEHKGAELWNGKPSPEENALLLGIANLGFRVELDDPIGTYRIEAVVHDRIASVTIQLAQALRVLPAEKQ